MINFNEPICCSRGLQYMKEAIVDWKRLNGDGHFTALASRWMEETFHANKVLLTTSCTHALEMAAMLCNIAPGDEVIMPSYTFVSTANAFVLRGARIKFVDIRPDTMNIDESKIESAITKRTKAIVVVHYAGVGCNMDKILEIANQYKLLLIEDAAQGVMSKYKEKYLGTIGDVGCYSFHETKNYTMGEGGAIVINNPKLQEKADIIREKGTNRKKFLLGEIDKYSWVDIGSSYLPSELNVAYLYAQFECAVHINNNRIFSWNMYNELLQQLSEIDIIELPIIPFDCVHNAHMYYIKVKDKKVRTKLLEFLKYNEIGAVFHYIPLHSSVAGINFSSFVGDDVYTTKESERLLRLPMYYGLKEKDIYFVVKKIYEFFNR